jgi:hypothetical protein
MTMQRFPVSGPWKGVITDMPSATDDQALDDCVNFFCRKGRIQMRPRWNVVTPPPDGQPIRAIYTFQDVLDNYHTLVLTAANAYFLTNPAGTLVYNLLTPPSGIASLTGTGLPFAIREINQQVYFSNGSIPLSFVDGSINVQVAGDVPGSCLYLTENSESLIGLNWTEPAPGIVGSQNFPFRVRWSDTGDPTEWINSPANTAGASDLIESGGALTGGATVGRNTYILRQEGATVMYPTGNGVEAFAFEPFIWSRPGWGNYYPYSLVNWGPLIICITESAEVLTFDGSNFNRLSNGKIRKRLAEDLALVSSDVVQCFGTCSMGPGYDLESYWISIPGPNIIWVHDLSEGTWQRMSSSKGWLTSTARVAVN